MKNASSTMIFKLALVIPILANPALAAEEQFTQQQDAEEVSQPQANVAMLDSRRLPVYKPPLRGAPASRVGGASRSTAEGMLTLSALAPDHPGLTISKQPTVYWYLSKAVATPLEFTLIDDQAIHPLLETRLGAPTKPGIQGLRLSDYPIQLEPGMEYQWFIALVPDPEQRAHDILAGGVIQSIEPPATLAARLNRADQQALPYLYAEAGLWYDAITAISALIEAHPGDRALREQRAALLEQVGLSAAADYDRNMAAEK